MAVEAKLITLFSGDGRVSDLLVSYREVDRRVFAELEIKERETFGFPMADAVAS